MPGPIDLVNFVIHKNRRSFHYLQMKNTTNLKESGRKGMIMDFQINCKRRSERGRFVLVVVDGENCVIQPRKGQDTAFIVGDCDRHQVTFQGQDVRRAHLFRIIEIEPIFH